MRGLKKVVYVMLCMDMIFVALTGCTTNKSSTKRGGEKQ